MNFNQSINESNLYLVLESSSTAWLGGGKSATPSPNNHKMNQTCNQAETNCLSRRGKSASPPSPNKKNLGCVIFGSGQVRWVGYVPLLTFFPVQCCDLQATGVPRHHHQREEPERGQQQLHRQRVQPLQTHQIRPAVSAQKAGRRLPARPQDCQEHPQASLQRGQYC